MKTEIYNYADYKKYINIQLDLRSETERGPRARLAEYVGCHLAYLSQVLNSDANLSLEQAELTSRFFGHSKAESLFFLNLVNFERAGTENLRKIFSDQIEEARNENKLLKNKLNLKKTISPEVQAVYYSSWDFLAIHVAVSISSLQTKKILSEALGLPLERVAEVVEFLEKFGFIKRSKDRFEIGESYFHLGSDSPFINKHHTNWRVQCLRSLDHVQADDLHYSSVISCNYKDVPAIREVLLQAIAEIRKIVRDSKHENILMSYCLDLFPVMKT